MDQTNSKNNILPIITSKDAVDETWKEISAARETRQAGLITRWEKMNIAMMGSWRFKKNYLLAGMSGSGKSYILNLVRNDFANKQLNKLFVKSYRILHIAFEMSATDELIRTVSSMSGISYQDLLSSYDRLSDEKYQEVKNILNDIYNNPIVDFIEVTGTVQQIHDTIKAYKSAYPNDELIVTLDHTLLTDYDKEKDETTLVTSLSKMFVGIKKDVGSMNILIGQLNTDIEDQSRILKAHTHYPLKKDIHGSKAVYRDADFVIVFHRPEMLNITRYGTDTMIDDNIGYPTKGIIFAHILKSRNSDVGIIRYKHDFKRGSIIELSQGEAETVDTNFKQIN